MNFTDEQITAIRAAGLEINPETLQAIRDDIDKLVKAIESFMDAIAEIIKPATDWLADICAQIVELPPRQRYQIVKKLGTDTYPVFFHRKPIYHCRNNC